MPRSFALCRLQTEGKGMDWISRRMYGSAENIARRNVLWNMFGSLVYALTSMSIGLAVSRILGAQPGGIFLFAFSTLGQQLYIVAYFGVRPIQVTDYAGRWHFGDYLVLRFLSAGLALLAGLAYTLLFARNALSAGVYMLMIVYKILDAVADCFESEWQRRGRLYIAGKSMSLRTLCSLGAFLGVLYRSRNLLLASVCFVLVLLLCILLFALLPLMYEGLDWDRQGQRIKELFHSAKWLFAATFLDLYVFGASKFAVDAVLGDVHNAYYGIIFIPTSVINLMAGFVIRPILTDLARCEEDGNIRKMKALIGRITALIALLGAAAAAAVPLLGPFALGFLFPEFSPNDISLYTQALLLVIIGGGLYAFMNLLYYVLVIFKEQKKIFRIYSAAALLALFGSREAVLHFGIRGAAASYLLFMLLLSIAFALPAYRNIGYKEKMYGQTERRCDYTDL